jgi:thiol-disulfide isomerase/thioredoxin
MKVGTRRRNGALDRGDLAEPVEVRPRRRRLGWWAAGAVVLAVASVAVAIATSDSLEKTPGTIKLAGGAKLFVLEDVRPGHPAVDLSKLEGRPVVLNFFGSWRPPCIRELPGFQAVSQRFKGKVAFVGVTFNDTREGARGVLERSGVTYPAGYDPRDDVALDYGLVKMPTTVFIGRDGNLVERRDGEFSEVQLEATINRLFFSGS